ncbi:MAG: DNA translocase FtsK [Actinobacteria bacterium]|nr:DNA translocase FtsK [Actinomycetota bacterium]
MTRRSAGQTSWAAHRSELIALACLGAAAFLAYVLLVGESGGLLGEEGGGALRTAFGRLAFLLPLALLGVAARLVFDFHIDRRSVWFWGLVAFVLGLLVLVAEGFTPLGPGHPVQTFVRASYAARAGWVGEAAYAGGVQLAGTVGVAIVAWLLVAAGLSMVTGVTLRRFVMGTGRAARVAQESAQDRVRRLRVAAGQAGERGGRSGPLDDPYLSGFGPGGAEPFGLASGEVAFDDDAFSEAPTIRSTAAARRDLVDGAAAYPDIYVLGGPGYPGAAPPVSGESVAESAAITHAAADGALPHGLEPSVSDRDDRDGRPRPRAERQRPLSGIADGDGHGVSSHAPAYLLPGSELLRKTVGQPVGDGRPDSDTAALLVETLSDFGVEARVIGMVVGPRVTRFELQLAPGTKVSKVSGLKDDLAYALASTEIRILAPIPGKQAVGVEVPNQKPTFVTLGDIYRDFPKTAGPLMVWLGKDISGKAVYTDLGRLPHLLIAGTTGSGKSGCVNIIISSILLRASPDQIKMILIDPKKVELSHFDYVPHLLVPVVTNMKNAAGVLHNIVKEMDHRYELMELERARNLEEANKARVRRGERALPYVVVVIDELADLMMVSPAQVEEYIIRLAQKARAVGIHLVVATQRPSVDVITGMIKANIPSRIAFAVSSQTDSRVILDTNGAEALLGMGDMLFKPLGSNRLQRIQGAFITEEEIHRLVTHCRTQAQPEYQEELLQPPVAEEGREGDAFDPDRDELLADAASLVLDTGTASVSMLQRRLRVGYTRAGRLIDMLERRGIVGPHEGSKARQILVLPGERERVLEGLRSDCPPYSDVDEAYEAE